MEKMDLYDRRLTSMCSDISKVQSQVDLSMRSIQALQKEQLVLLQSVNPAGIGGVPGPSLNSGVLGTTPPSVVHPAPHLLQQQVGDQGNQGSSIPWS
jgi:hypothetical protein